MCLSYDPRVHPDLEWHWPGREKSRRNEEGRGDILKKRKKVLEHLRLLSPKVSILIVFH